MASRLPASPDRGSDRLDTSLIVDQSFMAKFKSQYSHYNDLRGSFASQLPGTGGSQLVTRSDAPAGKPTFVLNLHFLGLSGLPKAGWFERAPAYELIIAGGGAAKRLRPRIPAPPPGVGSDATATDLEQFMPAAQLQALQRLDDRCALRMTAPGDHFRVDVYEERTPFFDFGSKGVQRTLLGQCYVPLEHKYNRRPCTWPIVNRASKAPGPDLAEVGFLTCKFGLATMPGQVLNLRVVEGTVGANEVQLAWEPPESDGGTALRCYRAEARDCSDPSSTLAGILGGEEAPRTESAPAAAEPSVVLRNLHGNTEYVFCVWAVSEAGPGAGSEIRGRTGAVAPGLCGLPYLVFERRDPASAHPSLGDEGPYVEWLPPEDSGGADLVAYRVWVRPLYNNSAGEVWPSESWIDLGLSEHRHEQAAPQQVPLRHVMLEAMPNFNGCLCTVSALNAAGHQGPSTREVTVVAPQPPQALGGAGPGGFAASPPPGQDLHGRDPLMQRLAPGALAQQQLRAGISLVGRAAADAAPLHRQPAADLEVGPRVLPRPRVAGPAVTASPVAGADLAVAREAPPGRVVEASEIRPARNSLGAGDSRVLAYAPQPSPRGDASQAQAYYTEASLLETEGPEAIQSAVSSVRRAPAPQVPMACAGIDTNNDGRPNLIVTGVDMKRDGIPDVLQQAPASAPVYSAPGVVRQLGGLEGSFAGSWGLGQKGSLVAGRQSFR